MAENTDSGKRYIDDRPSNIIETRTLPPKDIKHYVKLFAKILWGIVSWGVIVATIVFVYVIGAFNQVRGGSMYATMDDGAYVYSITALFTPKRGDIVIARPEPFEEKQIIKRVIAVEGDELRFSESDVYLNGEILDEPYILEPMEPEPDRTIIIPEGHVWLMGDNRNNSTDSRHIGPVNIEDVTGKSIYHYNRK